MPLRSHDMRHRISEHVSYDENRRGTQNDEKTYGLRSTCGLPLWRHYRVDDIRMLALNPLRSYKIIMTNYRFCATSNGSIALSGTATIYHRRIVRTTCAAVIETAFRLSWPCTNSAVVDGPHNSALAVSVKLMTSPDQESEFLQRLFLHLTHRSTVRVT